LKCNAVPTLGTYDILNKYPFKKLDFEIDSKRPSWHTLRYKKLLFNIFKEN